MQNERWRCRLYLVSSDFFYTFLDILKAEINAVKIYVLYLHI